jgi:tetratricopeptide (TPR) repeat protein
MMRGKALYASGSLQIMFFDYEKAALRLEESLALFQGLGPSGKQGMAYALLRLGGLATVQDKAQSTFEQTLILFREIGDRFGMAECFMQLAFSAQRDGDYEQAVIFTEKELALSRESGDKDGIASALWNLGDLAFRQEDYQRAIALIEEGIILYRGVDNKWALGRAHFGLGNIFFWQGNYEQAGKIYGETLALGQEIGDNLLITLSIYNQGFIAWFQGDYIRAAQKFTDSLNAFRNMGYGYDRLTASSLHTLGDIALAQEDNKHAVQWYEAELAFGQEAELSISIAFAICGLGKVAWAQGDHELATKRFEQGLSMSQEADSKNGQFHALYGLGRVAQSNGDYSVARARYAEMLKMPRQQIKPIYVWHWLKTYGCVMAYPLVALAALAAEQNMKERAARLLSAAENLYAPLRFEMSAAERTEHDRAVAATRAALGEEAYRAAYEEGKKMTLDEAVAYALGDTEANVG